MSRQDFIELNWQDIKFAGFQVNIKGIGLKPADQFVAHPSNPKFHPQKQRDAVRESLEKFGWSQFIIENAVTGYTLDGHERIWNALEENEDGPIPYVLVEIPAEQEKDFILVYDETGRIFEYDNEKLDVLMQEIEVESPGLRAMLNDLAEQEGIEPPDFSPTDGSNQPRLDEKKRVICPECGHEFIPE
jgi:hypothetical protein